MAQPKLNQLLTPILSALRQDWNTYAGHLVGEPVAEAEVCLTILMSPPIRT